MPVPPRFQNELSLELFTRSLQHVQQVIVCVTLLTLFVCVVPSVQLRNPVVVRIPCLPSLVPCLGMRFLL